ncbi:hypothetical protein [Bulleidia sp. zg-1006]|uniref:hypothetical protein n=1 Tax=Bulleidia sp. zg-1006 TaxID=2806552 RepID=UPI001939BF3D|nr:hypothetical protein [Bulleidia sp. zg-1006]QRG87413.1 hypothetical protein JOS54_03645 [Bulleidia sp. zg-1006]
MAQKLLWIAYGIALLVLFYLLIQILLRLVKIAKSAMKLQPSLNHLQAFQQRYQQFQSEREEKEKVKLEKRKNFARIALPILFAIQARKKADDLHGFKGYKEAYKRYTKENPNKALLAAIRKR